MTSLSVAFFEASEKAKKEEVFRKNCSAAVRVMLFHMVIVAVALALLLFIKPINTDCSGLEPMEQQQAI